MNLIAPLVSGIQGAENGVARIFVRGTTIRANYWLDFEATSTVSSGADVALDSNGGAEVYVDVLVTVQILSTSNAIIREFVAGVSAPAVEVRSPSFTGTKYADATGVTVTGTSQPTTLQAVLDLWQTQNGSPDWKVLVNGASVALPTALASVSGLFFNVKDPQFGALGNGTIDDTSALDAASTAASAAGGGVVFLPPGTYRRTTEWDIPINVSVLGVGPNASVIAIDHPTRNTIKFTGSLASTYHPFQSLEGVRFRAIQANSGKIVNAVNANLLISNCVLGDGVNSNGPILATTGATLAQIYVDGCSLEGNTSGVRVVDIEDEDVVLHMSRCLITPNSTANGDVIKIRVGTVSRCIFRNSGVTSGTFKCIGVVNTSTTKGGVSVSDCNFQASGGSADSTAIHMGNVTASFSEAANVFATTHKVTGLELADHRKLVSLTSARQGQEVLTGTGNQVCDTDNYNTTFINSTDLVGLIFDLGVALLGHTHTVCVRAELAPITAVTGANTKGIPDTISIGRYVVWRFVGVEIETGDVVWIQPSLTIEHT